jgi:hypothetical protein
MNKITDNERSKLLFQMGFIVTLMTLFGLFSNAESIKWLFVDPSNFDITEGKVLSSKKEFHGTYGGWRFSITYEYEVDGHYYTSNRVHYGFQAMDEQSYAESYVEKYPVDKQVLVYYDPRNPGKSVLEPSVKWTFLLPFYGLLILLVIVIYGFSFYYKIKVNIDERGQII